MCFIYEKKYLYGYKYSHIVVKLLFLIIDMKVFSKSDMSRSFFLILSKFSSILLSITCHGLGASDPSNWATSVMLGSLRANADRSLFRAFDVIPSTRGNFCAYILPVHAKGYLTGTNRRTAIRMFDDGFRVLLSKIYILFVIIIYFWWYF